MKDFILFMYIYCFTCLVFIILQSFIYATNFHVQMIFRFMFVLFLKFFLHLHIYSLLQIYLNETEGKKLSSDQNVTEGIVHSYHHIIIIIYFIEYKINIYVGSDDVCLKFWCSSQPIFFHFFFKRVNV